MARKFFFFLLLFLGIVFIFWWYSSKEGRFKVLSPLGSSNLTPTIREKPLDKYTIENLGERKFEGSKINLGKVLKETPEFTSYLFFFNSSGKKVSGMANIPSPSTLRQSAGRSEQVHSTDSGQQISKFPVIVMLRGYVEREIYKTGMGTERAAEVFAKNGFITLAPDFLGYGESDMSDKSPIMERFQTYIVVLDLLASIKTLPQADFEEIGIWGHSNGGQIALSVLEITQKPYPTTLWAPVSKSFPYSVLYYTDTFEDKGKALRKVIADFEKDYDAKKYSIDSCFERVNTPIQLHQGSLDDQVPLKWSDELYKKLKDLNEDITYFVYPGADHNMVGSWDLVIWRDLEFFQKYLTFE